MQSKQGQASAVRLFSLLNFFWGFWGTPFSLFVAIYLSQAGISDSGIGLLFGLNSLMGLIVAFPSGLLSDRFNPRRAMLAGLVLTAPFYLAITLTDSFFLLFLIFIIDSLGANLYAIAADSAMYRAIESTKGKAFGMVHFLMNLGTAGSALVCGYVIAAFGFTGLGIMFLIPAVIVGALVTKIPRRTIAVEKHTLREYLGDFGKRDFLLFSVAAMLLAYHWGAEKTSFPLYASKTLLLTSEQLGVLFFINLVVYAVAGLFAGHLTEISKHRTRLFIMGLIISAAGSFIYSLSYDFGSALLSRLLHDSGDGMVGVSLMLAIAAISSKERMGGAVGAITIVYIVANFIGAVASGYINQYFGYAAAIQIAAALTFASAVVLAIAVKGGISRSPFRAD